MIQLEVCAIDFFTKVDMPTVFPDVHVLVRCRSGLSRAIQEAKDDEDIRDKLTIIKYDIDLILDNL